MRMHCLGTIPKVGNKALSRTLVQALQEAYICNRGTDSLCGACKQRDTHEHKEPEIRARARNRQMPARARTLTVPHGAHTCSRSCIRLTLTSHMLTHSRASGKH